MRRRQSRRARASRARTGRRGRGDGAGSGPAGSSRLKASADIVRLRASTRLADGARYDVAVAGGGAVGAALACALADSGASVLLADPGLEAGEPSPAFAPRPLALSLATERVLDSLGVWDGLAPAATPIESIHVSEAGRFGATRLEAAQCGVGRFGSVVAAGALGEALRGAVARRGAIHRTGGRIVDASVSGEQVSSRVAGDAAGRSSSVRASLLAVADGGRSELREALGVDVSVRDYRQHAIASVVAARAPRERTAFERFTPGGPVALLPMGGNRYGLVWSCGDECADALAGRGDREFADTLATVFAGRLGGFEVAGERVGFPLRLVRADAVAAGRAVLIGNAANHLHPVAGQGFNLGVRDVACLSRSSRTRAGTGSTPAIRWCWNATGGGAPRTTPRSRGSPTGSSTSSATASLRSRLCAPPRSSPWTSRRC